jgi:hypothetical protein
VDDKSSPADLVVGWVVLGWFISAIQEEEAKTLFSLSQKYKKQRKLRAGKGSPNARQRWEEEGAGEGTKAEGVRVGSSW